MLQAIRGQAASWIVKILFVLLILSFTAWGVTDWLRSAARPTVVAEIGPVHIEPAAFAQAVSQEMQRFRQALGANFDRDQARAFGLPDRVIEEIVERTLLELEAKRIGVTISDDVVRDSIRNNPAFKDEAGNFDRNKFEAVINRAGYSEARFIDEIRHDLERTQLVRPLLAGVQPPQAMVDAILRYRGERRVADTFLVSRAAVGAIPTPTDAQLEEYLKANSARFTRPELRTLSYFTLSPADRAKRIEVSDADAKQAYQSRVDEFTTPEQRTVEQLLLPDEATANQAAAALAAGKPFETVAKEHGRSADDIKFGAVKRDELPPEFAAPVFDLAANGVTKPIKSGFGWHIFKVTEIKPQTVQPFEAVKSRVVEELKLDKAGDEVPQLANQLEDALAGGANLDDAAAKADATVRKTPPLDRHGQGADGKKVADLPTGDTLLSTAFGLTESQTSRLVDTGDDSYLVVRVDHVAPAALPPLTEIRSAVSDAWTKAQQDSAAKQRADGLVAQLKSGAAIAKVAADAGAAVKTSTPFTRDGTGAGADVPIGLIGQLFGGPVGTVGVAQAADGYVVGRLKEVLPVDPTTADAQRKKLTDELRQAASGDLVQEFESGLRDRFSVTINQKAVEQAL